MSEVDVLFSKVHDCEVDLFVVFADCEREFDEFSDIPTLIAGSVSIVNRYGN